MLNAPRNLLSEMRRVMSRFGLSRDRLSADCDHQNDCGNADHDLGYRGHFTKACVLVVSNAPPNAFLEKVKIRWALTYVCSQAAADILPKPLHS